MAFRRNAPRLSRPTCNRSRVQLELHFLPGYALPTSSFATTWARIKKNERLKDRVEKDLAKIKRSPRLVRSFFRAESVGYIKD